MWVRLPPGAPGSVLAACREAGPVEAATSARCLRAVPSGSRARHVRSLLPGPGDRRSRAKRARSRTLPGSPTAPKRAPRCRCPRSSPPPGTSGLTRPGRAASGAAQGRRAWSCGATSDQRRSGGYRREIDTLPVDGSGSGTPEHATEHIRRARQRRNGRWGGCWCASRPRPGSRRRRAADVAITSSSGAWSMPADARGPVRGDVAVTSAQFGTVPELPNIHHRRSWSRASPGAGLPDHGPVRRPRLPSRGNAAAAVRDALALIAAAGAASSGVPADRPDGAAASGIVPLRATRHDARRGSATSARGWHADEPRGGGSMSRSCVARSAAGASTLTA